MASLIVLKGNGSELDLTTHIPVPNYQVNNIRNYEEWKDASYVIHRQLTDEKIEGSFTLKFNSIQDYEEFVSFYMNNRDLNTGAILCDLWIDNEHVLKVNKSVFLDFEPQNDLPLMKDNKSEGFTVTISERG